MYRWIMIRGKRLRTDLIICCVCGVNVGVSLVYRFGMVFFFEGDLSCVWNVKRGYRVFENPPSIIDNFDNLVASFLRLIFYLPPPSRVPCDGRGKGARSDIFIAFN